MDRSLGLKPKAFNLLPKLILFLLLAVVIYYLRSVDEETKELKALVTMSLQDKLPMTSHKEQQKSEIQILVVKECKNGGLSVNGKCECVAGYKGDHCEELSSPLGGAWSADVHIGAKYHDLKVVPKILELLSPSAPIASVMDVGCGLGLYLKDFYETGTKRCVGVEPSPMNKDPESPFASRVCEQLVIDAFDLQKPEIRLSENFDLVMSMEVAEHIERAKHTRYFNFLTNHAKKWIVFSGAVTGQGGHGHIAERPWHEWKQEFETRGWTFDSTATEALKHAASLPWFRNNLAVFKKL